MTTHTFTITTTDPDHYLTVVASQVAEGYTSGHHDDANHWSVESSDPRTCPTCGTAEHVEVSTAHAVGVAHYHCRNCNGRRYT